MRLVPFLLSALLTAQTPGKLPWDAAPPIPWKAGDCGPAPAPAQAPPASKDPAALPLRVILGPDGALRITNARGVIPLRTGLPGRPLRIWRDGGTAVEDFQSPIRFAGSSPISRGIGALPVGAPDFRPALEGLLWILSDDQKVITLIYPATSRLCYLPLPGGRNFELSFHPDRLELRQTRVGSDSEEECWSIPWLALLPQLIQLGQENPANRPSGTALLPYPKE